MNQSKSFNFRNFIIDVHDYTVKVLNTSEEPYNIFFINNTKNYCGHSFPLLKKNCWVSTNPTKWQYDQTKDFLTIKFISQNQELKALIDFKKGEIVDTTDPNVIVENFQYKRGKISVLISAFGTENYLLNTINSILVTKPEHIDVEILVGIDDDTKILKLLSDSDLSEYVKVYLSLENVGPYIMFNSLIEKTQYETIVIFGSDDLATRDFLNIVNYQIQNFDILRWRCEKKFENTETNSGEILEMPGCFAIKKNVLLKNNGFKPWRVQGDDEFQKRVDPKSKTKKIDNIMFEYLIRQESLSRDKSSSDRSMIRRAYVSIIEDSIRRSFFRTPNRLYTQKLIRVI
jgi:hypothetical protein